MLIENLSQFFKKPISGCIHIGAHHAEEKDWYTKNGITNIVWIDANEEYFEIIKNKCPNDIVIISGIGNNEEEIEFNVSNNGQSSSFLEFGTHSSSHPDVFFTQKKKVKIKKMKNIYEEFSLDTDKYNFLNMDIQGYELEALRGFGSLLHNFDYVYTEVNTNEVYKNCAQLSELDSYLKEFGFERKITEITSWNWGDAFYLKK